LFVAVVVIISHSSFRLGRASRAGSTSRAHRGSAPADPAPLQAVAVVAPAAPPAPPPPLPVLLPWRPPWWILKLRLLPLRRGGGGGGEEEEEEDGAPTSTIVAVLARGSSLLGCSIGVRTNLHRSRCLTGCMGVSFSFSLPTAFSTFCIGSSVSTGKARLNSVTGAIDMPPGALSGFRSEKIAGKMLEIQKRSQRPPRTPHAAILQQRALDQPCSTLP
jgi:hypothetical protein